MTKNLLVITTFSVGGMVILDGKTWKVDKAWVKDEDAAPFGYDFWYQYKFNQLIATEYGAPWAFWGGFNPAHVASGGECKNKEYPSTMTFRWGKSTFA